MKNLFLILTIVMLVGAMAPTAFAAGDVPATWTANVETVPTIDFDPNTEGHMFSPLSQVNEFEVCHGIVRFAPTSQAISAFSTPVMTVPGGTLFEYVSDWVELELAVANAFGSVEIRLEDDITATGQDQAIIIPQGLTVYLSGNGYSIYQDSTFVVPAGSPVGAGSYSWQRRHFVVEGELFFDNVTLTRSVGVTHRGGGVFVRPGGHAEMFSGAVISNNDAVEYSVPLPGGGGGNLVTDGGGVLAVDGSFVMHGGEIYNNTALRGGGGIGAFGNAGSAVITIHDGLISDNTAAYGGAIRLRSSTLNMHGGEISDNTASSVAGGICLSGSTFTMFDGKILNNHADGSQASGGGVRVHTTTMTMHDGLISGNTVNTQGGGIALINNAHLIMHGGEISDNHVLDHTGWNPGGGGVFLDTHCSFTMNGGEISENTAVQRGGGVFIIDSSFTMNGGDIRDNEAILADGIGAGGGILAMSTILFPNTQQETYVTINGGRIIGNTAATSGGGIILMSQRNADRPDRGINFIMTGGSIGGERPAGLAANAPNPYANTAFNGGGVFVQNFGNFTMSGGEIVGNTAANLGGGLVFAALEGPFTMTGGEISDNAAPFGGGVFVNGGANPSTFVLNGGEINDNRATQGGGVFTSGFFTMNNGEVSGNEVTQIGGGVFVNTNGGFTMGGGEVSDNTAVDGGGVFTVGPFTATAGSITNNTATGNGGGIFAWDYSTLTTSSAIIFSDNTASSAHDFFLHPDFATMTSIPAADSGGGNGGTFATIEWATVSILNTHALNNFDINYVGLADMQIVRFHPNGGLFTGGNQLPSRAVAFGGTYASAFDVNDNLVNPDLLRPTRTNYEFGGWFDTQLNADGTGDVGRVLHTHDVTATAERTLWARWTATHTITYRAGINGVGAEVVDDVALNQVITLRTADPVIFTRDGHTLSGWNTAEDGSGAAHALGASHTVTGNLILYAQWTVNQGGGNGGNGGGGNGTGNATIVTPTVPPAPPQPPAPLDIGYERPAEPEAPASIIVILLFTIAVAAFCYRKVEGAKEK